MAKIARQRVATHFAYSASQLHPGGSATDDDECEQPTLAAGSRLPFGSLERTQDTPANLGCLGQVFKPRSYCSHSSCPK